MRWFVLVFVVASGAGCGGPSTAPAVPVTPDLVARAKVAWPAASLEALERGRATFVDRCQQCHALPDVETEGVKEWPGTLDDMAKRAGLSQAERDDVQHYVLAAHR